MGRKRKERVAMAPRKKEGMAILMVGVYFVRKPTGLASSFCVMDGSSSE